MKPPKPRITKPGLVWRLNRAQTQWIPYHRVTWTEAGKRRQKTIKLDWKGDAQELDALYWACTTGRHPSQQPTPKYTWEECIIAWRGDPKGQGRLSASTKRSYARPMERILAKNAKKDMRKTTAEQLYKMHTSMSKTPREADRVLQTVSRLWNYAKNNLFWPMPDNPATGIKHFGKQREFEPWPEWMVTALPTAPQSVQIAAAVILGTGQRPSAAISMRRDQFLGDYMIVKDEKGGKEMEVFCPPNLKRFIADLPKSGAHLLAKNLTQPLSYDAIEKQFRKWRKDLGNEAVKYSLHGLRKLAIIELAEAGASDAEIQAVTGQSAEMVAYYRQRASRKHLSRSAHERKK